MSFSRGEAIPSHISRKPSQAPDELASYVQEQMDRLVSNSLLEGRNRVGGSDIELAHFSLRKVLQAVTDLTVHSVDFVTLSW